MAENQRTKTGPLTHALLTRSSQIQAHAWIGKYCLALHACVLRCTRQGLEFHSRLFAQFNALGIGRRLVAQFLASCLNRKILLGLSNFRFAWVTVLCNEVTGEAGEVVIVHYLYRALTAEDRFAGAGKVMA